MTCKDCKWLSEKEVVKGLKECLKPGKTIYGVVDPKRYCSWCTGKEIKEIVR